MNILLTGASGLIGSALRPVLAARGHQVIPLLRQRQAGSAYWNPARGEIDLQHCGSLDAVIHLAGETVAQRWTAGARKRIRSSRVDATQLLVGALRNLPTLPKVFLAASATGYYGDRGEESLDETSARGTGFLSDVCRDWEEAARPMGEGVRVVHLRFGIVLAKQGGALAKMLPVFRLGLGGRIGDGQAWWSWIALPDLLEAIVFALEREGLRGPVNMVTPEPVRNATFTRALGKALRKPAVLPVPAFALKLAFGKMAQETMLASFRVRPARLVAAGFVFRHSQIEAALRELVR